ncbi:MAG: YbhB/YbcL family Raf kinase inhibitor-like protein [Candidatus Omnitrophica bacterium]|nr:YbhB/YbcL family Raf kinase inhibitor-like protein [Candidatus Omnitrophota bacterium]
MRLTSPDFEHNHNIPVRFTCQGEDISPNLYISEVPEGTKSLVLIVNDPDATNGNWDHWIVFNIAPDVRVIPENSIPGVEGMNDYGRPDWGGPCPPRGTHRYFFKLYALDRMLSLPQGVKKAQVLKTMEPCILQEAELIGLYTKH